MTDKIRKLGGLVGSPADLWLMLRIASWIVATPLLLRLLPLPTLMAVLTPARSSNSARAGLRPKIIEYTILLLGRQRAMFRRNCLKRCLVVYRFLRLAGEPAVIFFGVRREGSRLAGHSWIEVRGEQVFDEPEKYSVTYFWPRG